MPPIQLHHFTFLVVADELTAILEIYVKTKTTNKKASKPCARLIESSFEDLHKRRPDSTWRRAPYTHCTWNEVLLRVRL